MRAGQIRSHCHRRIPTDAMTPLTPCLGNLRLDSFLRRDHSCWFGFGSGEFILCYLSELASLLPAHPKGHPQPPKATKHRPAIAQQPHLGPRYVRPAHRDFSNLVTESLRPCEHFQIEQVSWLAA